MCGTFYTVLTVSSDLTILPTVTICDSIYRVHLGIAGVGLLNAGAVYPAS